MYGTNFIYSFGALHPLGTWPPKIRLLEIILGLRATVR